MKKSTNDNSTRWAFWVCLCTSIVLLVTSFILPPRGIIDNSVIGAVGEIFAFATLYEFISLARQGKTAFFTKGDTTIKISDSNAVCSENE